jgi:hypothetical protein
MPCQKDFALGVDRFQGEGNSRHAYSRIDRPARKQTWLDAKKPSAIHVKTAAASGLRDRSQARRGPDGRVSGNFGAVVDAETASSTLRAMSERGGWRGIAVDDPRAPRATASALLFAIPACDAVLGE